MSADEEEFCEAVRNGNVDTVRQLVATGSSLSCERRMGCFRDLSRRLSFLCQEVLEISTIRSIELGLLWEHFSSTSFIVPSFVVACALLTSLSSLASLLGGSQQCSSVLIVFRLDAWYQLPSGASINCTPNGDGLGLWAPHD